MSSLDIADTLRAARTIAVVGCSPRSFQTSHRIARYIQEVGIRMIPVNPNQTEILGETCYPDLVSIPNDIEVDVIDVFRRPEFVADVVRDAADRAERTGRAPVVWTQIGVHSPEAEQLAAEAGLPYVADRCLMVDHARLGA
ncbi:CoA-binding protein [Rubrivirga sp. IMCC43871]|uniref:CoA-binding protein n=1 Tax=Rubrivirga sp. IMCC43871 TaxID=3391575 RepID=UPI00398FA5D4